MFLKEEQRERLRLQTLEAEEASEELLPTKKKVDLQQPPWPQQTEAMDGSSSRGQLNVILEL